MPQKTKEISIGSRKTRCIIFAISFASVLHFWPHFFLHFRRKFFVCNCLFFSSFFQVCDFLEQAVKLTRVVNLKTTSHFYSFALAVCVVFWSCYRSFLVSEMQSQALPGRMASGN